jgi:hypothetical protein
VNKIGYGEVDCLGRGDLGGLRRRAGFKIKREALMTILGDVMSRGVRT